MCGLKLFQIPALVGDEASHPSWVCGLKPACGNDFREPNTVTPFVGVWIETARTRFSCCPFPVTPFVGVWIETALPIVVEVRAIVTPFVGVWIETQESRSSPRGHEGHTLRGCVD